MSFDLYPDQTGRELYLEDDNSLWPVTASGKEIDLRLEFQRFLFGSAFEEAKGQVGVLRRARRDIDGKTIPCSCIDIKTREPDRDTPCSLCITGDGFISTEYGYKRIDELVIGSRVLTRDGTYQSVSNITKTYRSDLIKFKARLRRDPLCVTPEHRLFAIKKEDYRCSRFTICEVTASELNIGDLLLMPKVNNFTDIQELHVNWDLYSQDQQVINKMPQTIVLTNDFLWMIGLWVAEGSTGGERKSTFHLNINEVEYAQRVEQIIQQAFPGLTVSHSENPETHNRGVHIYSAPLARWLRDICGTICDNKHLPYILMNLPPERLYHMLIGMWNGDGTTQFADLDRKSNRAKIGMTSREAIYQGQLIAWLNNIYAGISTYQTSGKRRVYELEWTINRQNKKVRGFYEFDHYWASEITGKQNLETIAQPVYDITVEHNHNFVVNHILSHNCWGEGKLWDEEWVTWYKTQIRIRQGLPKQQLPLDPGEIAISMINFYLQHNVEPTTDDKIIEVSLDVDGNVIIPCVRKNIYRIGTAEAFRSDNGRVEYWRVAANRETVVSNWQENG